MFCFQSSITFGNAKHAALEALNALKTGTQDFSFEETRAIDSSALAIMISLKRAALAQQKKITFSNIPDTLQHLIAVYGLQDILDSALART